MGSGSVWVLACGSLDARHIARLNSSEERWAQRFVLDRRYITGVNLDWEPMVFERDWT